MSLLSLKNVAKQTLNQKQISIVKNIVQPPWLYTPLSKNLCIILGCQRSGTTLTYLILNSHPQIKGIDETDSNYCFPHPIFLYYHWLQRSCLTCLKLPNQTFNLEYIAQYFPQAKIVWLIRHPYSVVSSMRKFKTRGGNWLNQYAKKELSKESVLVPEINNLQLDNLDEISLGATVWKYKNAALEKFKSAGFAVLSIKYEELLENPSQIIAGMLDFIDLEWHENLLKHHQSAPKHKDYPGGTKGNIPIDKSRKKPQLSLSDSEIKTIDSICQADMKLYGY